MKKLLKNKTKGQKIAIIAGCTLGAALLAVVVFFVTVYIILSLSFWPGYAKYGHYENFEQYREQFDIVKNLFEDCEEGVYNLSMVSATDLDLNPIPMTAEQNTALNTIQSNCKYHEFDSVVVTEDYIWFYYFDYGCGIMYTDENIRRITRQLEKQSIYYPDEKYGFTDYGDGWYGVYR